VASAEHCRALATAEAAYHTMIVNDFLTSVFMTLYSTDCFERKSIEAFAKARRHSIHSVLVTRNMFSHNNTFAIDLCYRRRFLLGVSGRLEAPRQLVLRVQPIQGRLERTEGEE